MKRIGVISRGWSVPGSNEKGLDSFLGNEFGEVAYFDWRNVSDNMASVAVVNGDLEDSVSLSNFDLVYLSSLGAIEGNHGELINFIENLDLLPGKVINDPRNMVANFDKGYLLQLQQNGFPVIPTQDVSGLDYSSVMALFDGGRKVFKPRLFGERMEGVVTSEDIGSDLAWENYKAEIVGGPVLVQPFMEEILEGERSFVYVGDKFSHGVYRARSDWKKNEELEFQSIRPTVYEAQVCEGILKSWSGEYHVSRFDFIGGDKAPRISEVEMINPNLWLGRDLEGVDENFGKAFLGHVSKYALGE